MENAENRKIEMKIQIINSDEGFNRNWNMSDI